MEQERRNYHINSTEKPAYDSRRDIFIFVFFIVLYCVCMWCLPSSKAIRTNPNDPTSMHHRIIADTPD